MQSDFPHPEVLEYLGFWRRRRQPERFGSEELDDAWVRSMRERSEHSNRKSRSKPCTIFRVPEYIRQDEPTAYEPTVVSIGPLHWSSGSPNGLAAMEETKWEFFRRLLDRRDCSRESGLFDACLAKMKALEEGARDCYPEHSLDRLSHDQFAEILLLDGCFILYYLLKESEDKRSSSSLKEEDGTRWWRKWEHRASCYEWIRKVGASWNESMRKVGASCNERISKVDDVKSNIEELDDSDDRKNPRDVGHHDPSITKGDDEGNLAGDDGSMKLFAPKKKDDNKEGSKVLDKGSINGSATFYLPKHNSRASGLVKYDLLKLENQIPFYIIETLFDLLKTPDDEDLVDMALNFFEALHPKRAKPLFQISSSQVDHLLQLFHMSIIPQFLPCCSRLLEPSPTGILLDWIPSATELQKSSGVKFKKGESEAGNFLNINFSKGVMEIGPIRVFNHSSCVFRNLVAFEERTAVPSYVTIYAFFMGRIMRTGEDVRLLRSKGIVLNRRGSDEDAASFFDQLCKRIHYPDHSDYLRDIFIKLRNYHESRSLDWKARWHGWKPI